MELYKIVPVNFNKIDLQEISLKSMPMGAKNGDFITTSLSNGLILSGYIFTYHIESERDIIASLIVIFDTMNYNVDIIKSFFEKIILSLRKNKLLTLEKLAELLNLILECFQKEKGILSISPKITLSFDLTNLLISNKKDKLKEFTSDVWL